MPITLRYYGHAAMSLTEGSHCLVVDPFFSGNPHCGKQIPGDLKPTLIALTHGHWDHLGDTVELARQHDCPVFCVPELGACLARQGVKTIGGNHGGRTPFDFGSIKMVFAYHSSGSNVGDDRVYTGLPCGFVIRFHGLTVYHAGDTCLFGDMAYIARENVDVALLPIGDKFTMDPEDALIAASLVKPKHVIPIHYDTFPPIKQDPAAFAQRLAEQGIKGLADRPPVSYIF